MICTIPLRYFYNQGLIKPYNLRKQNKDDKFDTFSGNINKIRPNSMLDLGSRPYDLQHLP